MPGDGVPPFAFHVNANGDTLPPPPPVDQPGLVAVLKVNTVDVADGGGEGGGGGGEGGGGEGDGGGGLGGGGEGDTVDVAAAQGTLPARINIKTSATRFFVFVFFAGLVGSG